MLTYTGRLIQVEFSAGSQVIGIAFLERLSVEQQVYGIKRPEHTFGAHISCDGVQMPTTQKFIDWLCAVDGEVNVELHHDAENGNLLTSAKFMRVPEEGKPLYPMHKLNLALLEGKE